MKKKHYIEKLRVEDPCTQEWNEMIGNDQVRFCTHCAKDVNNLSAMTRRDAMRLVRRSNGNLCIRYIQHPETKGPVFSDQLVQISRRVPRVAAGVMSASISLSTFAYAQGGSASVKAESCPPPPPAKTSTVDTRTPDARTTASDDAHPKATDQPGFSTISGVVSDPNGAVIPGATVLLQSEDGRELSTVTDAEGNYRLSYLSPSKYTLAALAPGFRKSTVELTVREAKDETADLTLSEGIVMGGAMISVKVEYKGELMLAVDDDDIEKARDLIAAGEDVNRQEEDETTPLFVAVERGNLDMIRLLLNSGAKVNARNEEKQTPLMMIDEDASVELVSLLLQAGAKVDRVDESGDTALIRAAKSATPDILKALIDAGSEIDAQNDEGVTALMNAADQNNLENVRTLILAGADVNLRDKEGDNAWDYATDEDVENLLVSHGVVLDPEDLEGAETPSDHDTTEEPAPMDN